MSSHRSLVALIALTLLPASAAQALPYTFTYASASPSASVSLVGSFNQWDRTANPMRLEDGRWSVSLDLPPGEYAYKFVVDGSTYVVDPVASRSADDGFGGRNALLRLETAASASSRAIGTIDPGQLRHRLGQPDRNRKGERTISLRIATRPGDLKRAVLLIDRHGHWQASEMSRFAQTPFGDYYRTTVDPERGPVRYVFWLLDSHGARFWGPRGLSDRPATPFVWDWQASDPFLTPRWAKGAVFYQIFPERFANGDPRNDPPGVKPWGQAPTDTNFFGGDLRGIRQRLTYLAELGVEGIYLNPIFEAPSNHKYDTTDYTRVDPAFGSFDEFRSLCDEVHRAGMRVILDGVFNHTGTAFAAFREAVLKGPRSPAFNWYTFEGFPVVSEPKPNYRSWWGYASLPQLNVANPEVGEYLLSVAQRWLGPGLADGWRLDVPNEVPRPFWTQFRVAVRARRPDALSVGEIWGDGSPWLSGDAFDSVMNYRFRTAVLDFLATEKTDARGFAEALDQIRADYPDQVEPVLFNLIDSHDTPRFLNEVGGDKARLRLAAFLQLTLPGMPVIYYGDEVGMTGGKDPDNRQTMVWDRAQQDRALYSDYQLWIAMRRQIPALQMGDYERVASPYPRVFAFRRTLGRSRVLVLVNASSKRYEMGENFPLGRRLYPTGNGTELGPWSGVILQQGT